MSHSAEIDALARALCEHFSRTKIVRRGVVIEHRQDDEPMPCESCRAAARSVTTRVIPSGEPCPTCAHPEGYDRLSGPCPTCHGTGVIPPAMTEEDQ